jgi:hypothetical protein
LKCKWEKIQMSKIRVTQEYDRLSNELKEQIKLVYPQGYSDFLISYSDKEGKRISALRFETDEKIYLIRMTFEQAVDIIESDTDYDDDGSLNDNVRVDYEQKHSDVDYLSENDNYEA